MARKRNPLAQAAIYGIARVFMGLLAVLPLPASRRVAITLGRIGLAVVPRLHRVGAQQLDLAYGDTLSRDQKRQILREAMDNIAIVAAEFAHGPKQAALGYPGVKVIGRENVDLSRGLLIISGHLGNWEWLGPVFGRDCKGFVEVVRPFDYPPMDRFIDQRRHAMGTGTLAKQGAGKELLQHLAEGGHAGLMVDQSPRENAVPATFFGRNCWATIGPTMIAARAEVPVHYVAMIRQPDYSYEMHITPPLPLVQTGNTLEDLVHNTQLCQDALEELVRKTPGQWLWFHRRWKQRPRLEEEWQARLARSQKVQDSKAT